MFHPRLDNDGVWTQAFGTDRGHRAMDAELAGFIIRGRDDSASFGRPPHDDRLPNERRIIAFLDRGVESIHVDMEDHGALLNL